MTPIARVVLTLGIFGGMLGLVVVRPRRWNEAWWTSLGAAAMLGLGLVSPRAALDTVVAGKSALLFLLALLALSLLIGKSGFFDWAAIRCARIASGDARALYRNTFVLGAVVTAVLSLDTTAVLLTPIVLALARRLKLPSGPYVVLCAYVANVGSLLLPVSNLTNILFLNAFGLTFATFAARMVAPQLVALSATFALLRWHFRGELPAGFDGAALLDPARMVPHSGYFVVSLGVLVAVLVGYFIAPLVGLEPYVFAFGGCAILAAAGAVTGRVRLYAVAELSWSVLPFVIGLFVAVRGLENLGLVDVASQWFAQLPQGSPRQLFAAMGSSAVASNLMNNLPAALLARTALSNAHAGTGAVLAALIGANVGSIVTPFGSLATLLVLALARREGEEFPSAQFVKLGLWVTPVVAGASTVVLLAVHG